MSKVVIAGTEDLERILKESRDFDADDHGYGYMDYMEHFLPSGLASTFEYIFEMFLADGIGIDHFDDYLELLIKQLNTEEYRQMLLQQVDIILKMSEIWKNQKNELYYKDFMETVLSKEQFNCFNDLRDWWFDDGRFESFTGYLEWYKEEFCGR